MSRYYVVSKAKKVLIENMQEVKAGQVMYIDYEENEKQAPFDGVVEIEGGILTINGEMKAE